MSTPQREFAVPSEVPVIRVLNGFPAIERMFSINGRWDLVGELETATLADFSRTLQGIHTIHGIAATETSLLLEEV